MKDYGLFTFSDHGQIMPSPRYIFAGQALNAIIQTHGGPFDAGEWAKIALGAVRAADALLEELEK